MDSHISMYEKFGGEEMISKVVERFYELVLLDPLVNHFFKNVDIEKLRVHQTKFISFALGGHNRYTGKSMAKAHEGMNLQPDHFEAIVQHLYGALAYFGVNESDINDIIHIVESLKDDVLYK